MPLWCSGGLCRPVSVLIVLALVAYLIVFYFRRLVPDVPEETVAAILNCVALAIGIQLTEVIERWRRG